jgi:amicyanin
MPRTTGRFGTLLAAVGAVVLLSAAPVPPVRAANHAVAIAEFAFAPETLTITAGDTVTWTNEDAVIHTATGVNGAFDSGDLDQGESYSLTFTTPGTYDYLCTPHPMMTGRIVVVAAVAGPSAPAEPSGEVPNVAMAAPENGTSLRFIGAVLLVAGALLLVRRGRQRMPVS